MCWVIYMCASPRIIIMVIVIIIEYIIVIAVVIIIGRVSRRQLLFKASPFTENPKQIFKHSIFLTCAHTQVNNCENLTLLFKRVSSAIDVESSSKFWLLWNVWILVKIWLRTQFTCSCLLSQWTPRRLFEFFLQCRCVDFYLVQKNSILYLFTLLFFCNITCVLCFCKDIFAQYLIHYV